MHEYPIQRRRRQRSSAANSQKQERRWACNNGNKATVVTVIPACLRTSVDEATNGSFSNVHTDSLADALTAVREHRARGLLLSPALIQQQSFPEIAKFVCKNPSVTPVAVCNGERIPSEFLLDLGACGVRMLLDLRVPGRWGALRSLFDHGDPEAEAAILGTLLPKLEQATNETRHFFATLVRLAPSTASVRALARTLGVRATTFMSRFFRASVPSPKSYLTMTRMLYAAAFFERKGSTVGDVAHSLNFSSPQSFARHVRSQLGFTAGQFRHKLTLREALDRYVSCLITPYLASFRSFDPLGSEYVSDVNRGLTGSTKQPPSESRHLAS